MDFGEIIFSVIAFVIIIVILSRYFSSTSAFIREYGKMPVSKISKIKNGDTVKFVGEVVYAGSKLRAPLSGRKCSYYAVDVREKTDHKGRRRLRRTFSDEILIEEEFIGELFVKNGSSYAKVDADVINSFLVYDKYYSSGILLNATYTLKKFLLKYGYRSVGASGLNIPLDYSEAILEEGETVLVIGKASWKTAENVELEMPSKKYLEITAIDNDAAYITDDPNIIKAMIPQEEKLS